MVQGSQWPSFIIQGIIFGSDLYLISTGGLNNKWIFLSILCILVIFALQSTSKRFIFLFPVITGTNIKTTYWDTHIVRLGIIISATFLYISVQQHYITLGRWWFIAIGIFFIFFVPILFNFCINNKIERKIEKRFKQDFAVGLPLTLGEKRGTLTIRDDKLIWFAEKKYEISLNELISTIENR